MRKNLLAAICLIFSTASYSMFGSYASAVYVNINGTSSFYNTTAPGNGQDIGSLGYQGTNLGSYTQNSGQLILAGGEIKSYKGGSDNVCSGTMYFTVYPVGMRPVSPVFTGVGLGFYTNCTDAGCSGFPNSFPLAQGGGCCNPADQKWQFPGGGNGGGNDGNINLTTYSQGTYTLEVYYQITGEDNGGGCSTTKYDNNNSNPTNFTATFTIVGITPVNFGAITAASISGTNRVNWVTFSEQNTRVFLIERSIDGIQFSSIGEVAAAGNSSTQKQYFFTDLKPMKGTNYYRIKMVEAGGLSKYSSIVKTQLTVIGKPYVYPNPAKGKILIYGLEDQNTIKMYNSLGAMIYTTQVHDRFQTIGTAAFAPGQYFVQVINANGSNILQVIIEK